MALVFGGASLLLRRADILQMKMTIVDGLLGAALFGGLLIGRNPLKALLGAAFHLTDRAWAVLAMRYGAFWWACAVANEIVRNTQTQATWALFPCRGDHRPPSFSPWRRHPSCSSTVSARRTPSSPSRRKPACSARRLGRSRTTCLQNDAKPR